MKYKIEPDLALDLAAFALHIDSKIVFLQIYYISKSEEKKRSCLEMVDLLEAIFCS